MAVGGISAFPPPPTPPGQPIPPDDAERADFVWPARGKLTGLTRDRANSRTTPSDAVESSASLGFIRQSRRRWTREGRTEMRVTPLRPLYVLGGPGTGDA